jgi:ankyrin repeat protein
LTQQKELLYCLCTPALAGRATNAAMGDQHAMIPTTPAARIPAGVAQGSISAAAELRQLAARFAAGEVMRPEYIAERNRIRMNWSKTPPPPMSASGDHDKQCPPDGTGKVCAKSGPNTVVPKKGVPRGESAKKMEILNQLKKACENGDATTLRSCLQANPGLDIDALEDEGEMPSPLLNLAAESGFCEFVKVLIDEGKVEVDTLGEFGTTALFDACYFDNRDVAEALLDRGANPDFPDPDGSTPLYAAAFQGNLHCLDLMLQRKAGALHYHRVKDKLTPLHASVLGGNKDCVIKLVEAGHPLNPLDAEHQTPLLAAANGGPCGSNGKKDCLLELLKAGADARACDSFGRNAMHLLLLQGIGCPTCTYECAERLLEKQASVLEPDSLFVPHSHTLLAPATRALSQIQCAPGSRGMSFALGSGFRVSGFAES